jgi:quinol monooxygenase YgiN
MRAIRLIVLLAGCGFAAATLMPATAQDIKNGHREDVHMAADKKNGASNVFWTFGVAIKDGTRDKLDALIREMADASRTNEPGTLIYEWTIGADGKSAEVHERYADSDAALRHLASFNENYADRLMALVTPTGMTVYGNPSAALRKELEGANPVYMAVIGGFAR